MATNWFDSAMSGFGVILGVSITLTTANVITSYILPEGQSLSEWLDSKLDMQGVGA